jgi:hypothetical protein
MNNQNILNTRHITFCLLLFVALFGSLEVFSQQIWEVSNKSRFSSNMTLTAIAINDNLEMRSGNIEIGAFSGNDCRGSMLLQYEANFDKYIGYLLIYGDGNETITLKVYDHTNATEYIANNRPLIFAADAVFGSPSKPYVIALGTTNPDPEVTDVTVTPAVVTLERGATQQFIPVIQYSTIQTWKLYLVAPRN